MERTVIVTSKYHKSVCSVVRGTQEQINAILTYDPDVHGFKIHTPSDWDFRGEVLSLDTMPYNSCNDIIRGKAKLPKELQWMI